MIDPFLLLHEPDGTPFRWHHADVRQIDPVIKADGAQPAAQCWINEERYVLESPEEVHAAVLAKLNEKGNL